MWRGTALAAMLISALSIIPRRALVGDETGVRDFVTRWNAAYTGLNAKALAALETQDFELIDRYGHWIKSEGPEFNERLRAIWEP